MMDSSQNLLNNNTYTPYGTRSKHNSSYASSHSLTSVDTNYTFTGREDDGNGLMYYRNRYYSPSMKRFISEDPIGLNGGINQYAYVEGNPLSYSDPDGLRWVEVDIWNGAGFAGIRPVGHVLIRELYSDNNAYSELNIWPGGNQYFSKLKQESYNISIHEEGNLITGDPKNPTWVYKVWVNDVPFDKAVAKEKSKKYFNFLAGFGIDSDNSTNCTQSAINVLNAGGLPIMSAITPHNFQQSLMLLAISKPGYVKQIH